jgi:hypothetical protein
MMTVAQPVATNEVGDYDVRGPDYETLLVGAITERIIDADRLVGYEFSNGMPNFELYRTVLAGDPHFFERLRHWVVALTIAYAQSGGVRKDAYSDEFATLAAWDALYVLMHRRPMQPDYASAEAVGVRNVTYTRLRNAMAARLNASMQEYWIRMQVAIRQVILLERKAR